jgi:hypothetical protein
MKPAPVIRFFDCCGIVHDNLNAPFSEARLDAADIPGFCDGDWPNWTAQGMLGWIPKSIQEKYGRQISSTLNGPFLRLEPQRRLTDLSIVCVLSIPSGELTELSPYIAFQ